MRSKFLLATTSLVALGLVAMPASAKPTMMGEVEIDLSYYWEDWDYGFTSFEDEYTTVAAAGRVNVPYDEMYNIQVDLFGITSAYEGSDTGSAGHFGVGTHVNWRNPNEGLLGIFAGFGRANSDGFFRGKNANGPTFLAGFEGQYYCNQWTFYGQIGYWDSGQDTGLLQNAGFLRSVVSYYASPRLKLSGALKYINGDLAYDEDSDIDADGWDWEARLDYMFGKSMPVAAFLEFGGRYADSNPSFTSYNPELDVFRANIGVTFYLGGDGASDLMYQDRNGASVDLPDFDEVRVPRYINN